MLYTITFFILTVSRVVEMTLSSLSREIFAALTFFYFLVGNYQTLFPNTLFSDPPRSIANFSYEDDEMADMFFEIMNATNFKGVSVKSNINVTFVNVNHTTKFRPCQIQMTTSSKLSWLHHVLSQREYAF